MFGIYLAAENIDHFKRAFAVCENIRRIAISGHIDKDAGLSTHPLKPDISPPQNHAFQKETARVGDTYEVMMEKNAPTTCNGMKVWALGQESNLALVQVVRQDWMLSF